MTYLATTGSASGSIWQGKVYEGEPGATTAPERTLPAGVQGMKVRPSPVFYRKRLYITGQFSQMLLRTEFAKLHIAGIEPFTTTPTIAASGTGITGSCIGKVTAVHKEQIGGDWVVVHESAGGAVTNTLSLTNQGRAWSALPTTHPNPRVNFIRGYVSVDGADYALAWERELGTATVTENVATTALGIPINDNRGRPPYTKLSTSYHDRHWLAGNPDFPDRLYFGELEEYESFAADSFVKTRDGEAILALRQRGDTLVVYCLAATYVLQGYGTSDFVLDKVSSAYGSISSSIVDINDRHWLANQEGLMMFDGAFHLMSPDWSTFWRDDYLSNQAAYSDIIGAEDDFDHILKFLLIKDVAGVTGTENSFYYVVHYRDVEPALGGAAAFPRITTDVRARKDSAMGLLRDRDSRRGQFYTGSCDGYIRKENVQSNADDDGDSYAKRIVIQHRHDFFEDIDPDPWHGKRFEDVEVYIKHESVAITMSTWAGMEDAASALEPNETRTFAAAADPFGSRSKLPKNKELARLHRTAGEGLTLQFEAASPVGVSYRGMGISWVPGVENRAFQT